MFFDSRLVTNERTMVDGKATQQIGKLVEDRQRKRSFQSGVCGLEIKERQQMVYCSVVCGRMLAFSRQYRNTALVVLMTVLMFCFFVAVVAPVDVPVAAGNEGCQHKKIRRYDWRNKQ
jgi:predicted nucleic acid-binding Zn ribbon protein